MLHWSGSMHGVTEERVVKDRWFCAPSWLHAHHKDEDKTNNRIGNLEILTNSAHQIVHTLPRSRLTLLRVLSRARGRLTRIPGDFQTWKDRCRAAGIDLRYVERMYGAQGQYLGRGPVLVAMAQHRRVDHTAQALGIGTRRLKQLCAAYGLEYHHCVQEIVPVGSRHVYDLEVADAHNFVVNEICVHNCRNPNIQQIPATSAFRSCFVAPEGYKIVTADYSQAELRILCELSGDTAFTEAFLSGDDLHTRTAATMFGVTMDAVTKEQRKQAKIINFGLAYGQGPGRLANSLGLASKEDAKALIDQYFLSYSGIERWLRQAAQRAVQQGYSSTILGRKRYYKQIPALPRGASKAAREEHRAQIGRIERQGKNSPIQGSNSDMTKLAMVGIHDALAPYDARIINTVHDEIVVEVRADQAEAVQAIVEQEMVAAGARMITRIPVAVDTHVEDCWSKG